MKGQYSSVEVEINRVFFLKLLCDNVVDRRSFAVLSAMVGCELPDTDGPNLSYAEI